MDTQWLKDGPPKIWIARLFCKHEWERLADRYIYDSIEAQREEMPIERYQRWGCKKCGQLKTVKL